MRQVCDGGLRPRTMYLLTLVSPMSMPSLSSSPWMRGALDSGKLLFFSALEALRDRQAFDRHLDPVRNSEWVVYAKPPFAGPQQVGDYVGRYTHRVAISNHRIVNIEGAEVKFKWRDYRDNNQEKTMTPSRQTNSSGGFSCTFYQAGSIAFATTDFLPILIVRRSWGSVANFSA